jgi:hypothetical protein
MYAGVPITSSATVLVAPGSSLVTRATPKSSSLACGVPLCRTTMTLAGFRSPAAPLHLAAPARRVLPPEILKDQVIGSDVVDLANVGMVDRGNGARFALKPAHIVCDNPLDRDRAIQSSIVGLVDLAHASGAISDSIVYGPSRAPRVRSMW